MGMPGKAFFSQLLALCSLLLTGSALWAQGASPGDADAVVLLEERTVMLHTDGKVSEETLLRKKILTYEGMDREGDPHLAFNDRLETLTVIAARTATPWGTTLETQKNGMNPITPFAVAAAPFFTDARQMVVTHVGLDLGAVTELHWTVEDRNPVSTFLSGEEPLASHNPIEEKVLVLRVPEGTVLHATVLNSEAEYSTAEEGGMSVHTFHVTGVPLLRTELATPAELSWIPRVVYSTAPGWSDVADPFFKRCAEAQRPAEALEEKAREIVADESSPYRRIGVLHDFVKTHMKTVEWPLEAFAEAPRDAGEVLRSRYGLPLEKAVLLASLLDAVGIESEIVIASKGPVVAREVPSMQQFPVPLLEVRCEGRTLWVDPGKVFTGDARWEMLGRHAIRASEGEPFEVKPPVEAANTLSMQGTLSFDDHWKGVGEVTFSFSGIYSPHLKLLLDGENPEASLKQLAADVFDGCETESVTVIELSPERSVFTVLLTRKETPGDSLLAVALGNPPCSFAAKIHDIAPQSRDLPFLTGWTGSEVMDLEVSFPRDARRCVGPQEADVGSTDARAARRVTRSEGKIRVERRLEIEEGTIAPGDYPVLRKAVGFIKDVKSNTLYFPGSSATTPPRT